MKSVNVCPVVLAGGSGTRLWPLSRESFPKQLLRLTGEKTLLQDTITRLDSLVEYSNGLSLNVTEPIVVCNEEHRFLVAEQLEEIGRGASISLEPVSRNTAPALTIACLAALEAGGDPIVFVMPADHVITDRNRFLQTSADACAVADDGMLVTFGVVPSHAETGFGYIEKGRESLAGSKCAFPIERFVEKPTASVAESYLNSGDYLWNSGMFMMRATVWLQAIEHHAPEISNACRNAFDDRSQDGNYCRVDPKAFSNCPSDSIDYAVMEHLSDKLEQNGPAHGAVIPLDAGWSDIGSWSALERVSQPDVNGNVLDGDVFAFDAKDSVVYADSRLVAAVGVKDIIVVETTDAVLVVSKEASQDVKQVVGWLQANGREEGSSHRRVYRPWGAYEQLDAGQRYQVKRLTVKPGASLSLQMHHHRAEHWVVARGTARVTKGEDVFLLSENESTYIPLGVKHRLENPGKVVLEVIEVQSGSYLGEDDIVRFEDVYNREDDS
jgi:mannose-1-phosphate guanylyltransferase/mannose-6-phosphate isomerase